MSTSTFSFTHPQQGKSLAFIATNKSALLIAIAEDLLEQKGFTER